MDFKRVSAMVLAMLLCLSVASCGGSGDKPTDPQKPTTTKQQGEAGGQSEQTTIEYIVSTEKVEITAPGGSVIATQIQTVTQTKTNPTTKKPSGGTTTAQKTTGKVESTTVKVPATTEEDEGNVVYTALSEDKYRNYSLLSASQKQMYTKIKNAIANLDTEVDLGNCTQAEIKIVYTAVSEDNPILVWAPRGYSMTFSGGNCTLKLKYDYTKAQCDQMKKEMETAVANAFSAIKGSKDQYKTELRLHDYMVSKVTYKATSNLSYTAYGALVEGNAVCEGYSRAMQMLLNRAGIECSLVTGKSKNQGHMWNIVKIDGQWYHLDATWNDANNKGYHSYFNLSDTMILIGHQMDGSIKTNAASVPQSFNFDLPDCNSMAANYCNKIGTLVDSKQDFENKALNYFKNHTIKSGTVVEFCFSSKYDRLFESSMKDISDFISKYNSSVSKDKKIPSSYSISGTTGFKGFMVTFK
ncbi:MAG: hypothetical protein IJF54_05460 [Clostridia bacterium]|nr:hypothetical protein [Clostridia bacterium]